MSRSQLCREVHGLRQALRSRAELDQAKGVLVERYGIDAATAWLLLRRWSNEQERKVRDVARSVVEDAAQHR